MSELKIHIARFVVEAQTPLFIGSGKSSLLKDSLVQRDFNGFPFIPGTSLAGVLRHRILFEKGEEFAQKLFGSPKGKQEGEGSPVRVSPGMLLLEQKKVSEGLILDKKYDVLKRKFDQLPVRQHVRMTHQGAAKDKGLFDNEVIYKGVQFVFELEAPAHLLTDEAWQELIRLIESNSLRIGAGTRNGYGLLQPKLSYTATLNLAEYMSLSPAFNDDAWWSKVKPIQTDHAESDRLIRYKLKLQPDPFFIFGSGHGDVDVDQVPILEKVADYSKGFLEIKIEDATVIPGSSVKGAVAHRVGYYYNLEKGNFADQLSKEELDTVVENNSAVQSLFGKAGENFPDQSAGQVFFNDVFLSEERVFNEEILNHVVIDRFTGGAMEGLLFGEKVSYFKKSADQLVLEVELSLNEETLHYQKHLEAALLDICRGRLPLGGMTTKGHGIFTGLLFKNDKLIFPNA